MQHGLSIFLLTIMIYYMVYNGVLYLFADLAYSLNQLKDALEYMFGN